MTAHFSPVLQLGHYPVLSEEVLLQLRACLKSKEQPDRTGGRITMII
jgi:hypothetical protein